MAVPPLSLSNGSGSNNGAEKRAVPLPLLLAAHERVCCTKHRALPRHSVIGRQSCTLLTMPVVNATAAVATTDTSNRNVHRRLQFHAIEVCVSYVVMLLFSCILLKYTAFVHHQLRAGDLALTPQAILPTFRALLWTLAVAALVLLAGNLVLILALSNDTLDPMTYIALLYAGRHFVLAIAPALMRQQSRSCAALVRASVVALVLVFAPLTLLLVPQLPRVTELGASFGALLLFFSVMAIQPTPRACAMALRRYAAFALVHLVFATAHVLCVQCDILQSGAPFSSTSSVWTAATPLLVWQLLVADTAYWRGTGAESLALQQRVAHRTKVTERVSARGLHVLLELHRKHVLDFTALDVRQRIGTGRTAAVWSGLLRGRVPVSIKAYTPTDLSDEVLAEFSQEAALCAHLAHPNIVRFVGLSVCPPTIALVFELCRGSLRDLAPSATAVGCRSVLTLAHMLDAARAVAYLHSFSPPFIHRELELSSFLVDAHGVAKLAGFGDSRILHQFAAGSSSSGLSSSGGPRSQSLPLLSMRSTAATAWEARSGATASTTTVSSAYAPLERATSDATRKVSFHAPYSERVDVYALAIAFWQLLHPTVALPAPGTAASTDATWRPRIDAAVSTDVRELIEDAWHHDARARPTAAQLVVRLEAIKMAALDDSLECAAAAVVATHVSAAHVFTSDSVSGADAVRNLVVSNQVQHAWEAVRLGNAWMAAGYLHEQTHTAPFENKASRRYYFTASVAGAAAPRSMSDSVSSSAFGMIHGDDDDDDRDSVLVIGRSMSTRASSVVRFPIGFSGFGAASTAQSKRRVKHCACKSNARHVALPRRPWRAFATAESRAMAQHDVGLSASYESLLTSELLDDDKV